MPSHPRPDALADIAVELASGAGEIIQARRGERLDVLTKSTPTDMVTAVDHEVEAWLSAQIAARRSGDAILGEESAESPGHSGVRWIVDPIDGTVNFVLGLPQYAV
jgi:myo-inositol-1(or 4)-monophosphatase